LSVDGRLPSSTLRFARTKQITTVAPVDQLVRAAFADGANAGAWARSTFFYLRDSQGR
jgi:hypothetical protein